MGSNCCFARIPAKEFITLQPFFFGCKTHHLEHCNVAMPKGLHILPPIFSPLCLFKESSIIYLFSTFVKDEGIPTDWLNYWLTQLFAQHRPVRNLIIGTEAYPPAYKLAQTEFLEVSTGKGKAKNTLLMACQKRRCNVTSPQTPPWQTGYKIERSDFSHVFFQIWSNYIQYFFLKCCTGSW